MDREAQQALNREHVENPQEGDFWHEMFCPYFIVAEVTRFGVVVFHKTFEVDKDHYKFDESQTKFMTKQELRDAVTYSTMRDKFVADVRPKS